MERGPEQNFILDFIEVYRSLPALWNKKAKEYANRDLKNSQYEILVKKYQERYPNADKSAVIKKLNSLRTNYRQHRRKLNDFAKSGIAVTEDNLTTVFYFEALEFLYDDEKSNEPPRTNTIAKKQHVQVAKKAKKDSAAATHGLAAQKLRNAPDESMKIAETWAIKLKKMTPEQQLYADRFINEILFEGQLGNLHRDSVTINQSRLNT